MPNVPDVQVPYTWTDNDTNKTVRSGSVTVAGGDTSKPIVVLLHGNGGNAFDMSNPDGMTPRYDHDFTEPFPPDRDLGWSAYPGIGPWSFWLDNFKEVTGWQPKLRDHNFRTVNYSQIDPSDFLARPVLELAGILQAIATQIPDSRIALLAHSRGGLLARKCLKDNSKQPWLEARILKVITLHSPHQGSALADVAAGLSAAIMSMRSAVGPIVDSALGWLENIVNSNSYQELSENGSFLAALRAGETPIPGTQYFTFGGTSVVFTRLLAWFYAASSAFPQWHLPPFHHVITTIELPFVSPVLNSLPPLTDEIAEGKGDILVADSHSGLAFAAHQTNMISHAEALWDPNLQGQVLRILGEPGGIW